MCVFLASPTHVSTFHTCDEMYMALPLLIGGRAEQSYSCQTLVFECVENFSNMIVCVASWTLDMAVLFGLELEPPPENSCMARGYPLLNIS